MKENQMELEQLIREVMDQMDKRKYGKNSYTLPFQFPASYVRIT